MLSPESERHFIREKLQEAEAKQQQQEQQGAHMGCGSVGRGAGGACCCIAPSQLLAQTSRHQVCVLMCAGYIVEEVTEAAAPGQEGLGGSGSDDDGPQPLQSFANMPPTPAAAASVPPYVARPPGVGASDTQQAAEMLKASCGPQLHIVQLLPVQALIDALLCPLASGSRRQLTAAAPTA